MYKTYIKMFPGFVSVFIFFVSSKLAPSFSTSSLRICGDKFGGKNFVIINVIVVCRRLLLSSQNINYLLALALHYFYIQYLSTRASSLYFSPLS